LCYVISPLIFYKDVSALFMLSELQPYAQGWRSPNVNKADTSL
jgi:hypothetical protein